MNSLTKEMVYELLVAMEHGEHSMFENLDTGQKLEVSLGNTDDIGNVDPYFFYDFLKSTENFKHLIQYFKNPFGDMLNFFEVLEKQKILFTVLNTERLATLAPRFDLSSA